MPRSTSDFYERLRASARELAGGEAPKAEKKDERRAQPGVAVPQGRIKGGLEGVAGFGGFEEGDAAAEELLLGQFGGEDNLGGDEDGALARFVRNGDFDERLLEIALAALETKAAAGHVLALDDVVIRKTRTQAE